MALLKCDPDLVGRTGSKGAPQGRTGVTIMHRLRHKLYGYREKERVGVGVQHEDDARVKGRQLAFTVGILFAYCSHTMVCFQLAKREHNENL
jgi:hypothetical protein